MKDLQKLLEERNIEIFELNEKIQELQKYKALYFRKYYEVVKYQTILNSYIEMIPDEVKYYLKEVMEKDKIKYH